MSKKILIVDDEPDVLKMTEFRVKKAGYLTVTAMDGGEAVDKAASERPDLILLDYRLPVLDGGQVYVRIKGDEALRHIPVIMLTASRGNEDLVAVMSDIGVEHSILKPYDPEELLAKIRQLVGE